MPGMSSALAVVAAVPDCGAAAGGTAFAVFVGVIGLASPEEPGGGLLGAEPGLPGVPPGAVEVFGGALPAGAGGGVLPDEPEDAPAAPEEADPLADEAPPAALGSALRMIGRPSLPEPITTTLALGDCDSKSVASIPRQRK